MTTLRDICNAFAPKYLERYPHLPLSHRKVIRAIPHCQSGYYGHSLYQCQSCGEQHRVNHSCGNRPCPQGQHHKTQPWLAPHLDKQLPGPPFLLPFTVPETLRPFIRSHQRLASQALFTASSFALKRLAKAERFIGTELPGFTGVLHPWGRQLQYHPHIHYIVPGGGLSKDPTTWLPSRATFFVPVKALSPLYRALFKEDMRQAGLLEHSDPQVWNLPWNGHSQAGANGPTAFKYLAPYVFRVAISNRRLVSLQDRTVTFTYRQPRSSRPRTTSLDAMEFLRSFLQPVLPEGFMKVRHFGFRHASCAISAHTLRRMIVQVCSIPCKPAQIVAPKPFITRCPTCGVPMRLVMRLWTTDTCIDTSCERQL